MELSYETIQRIIPQLADGEWQYCSEYGEPGYEAKGSTPLVVLGDYLCRCGKVLREDGTSDMHTYEYHHPKVWEQMVSQGIEFEWYDEWTIDYDNDKAYRTTGDSYSWQAVCIYTDGEGMGDYPDMLTPDDELETWIGYMVNRPTHCLPSRVWSKNDLIDAGWESYNGEYESGWHPGQMDDPQTITDEIRAEHGDSVDIVFLLDEASQFYIGFSAWIRPVEDDED